MLDGLRADAVQSRDMQQKAIQWLGTVLASVMFGGLVYATAKDSTPSSFVLVILYGLVGPAIAVITGLIYLGELKRQGRTAVVLRSLEKQIAGDAIYHIPGGGARFPPIFAESAYSRLGSSGDKITRGYGVAGYYLAILALFPGGLVASVAIGASLMIAHFGYGATLWGLVACGSMALCFFVVSTWRLSKQVQKLAETTLELSDSGWQLQGPP